MLAMTQEQLIAYDGKIKEFLMSTFRLGALLAVLFPSTG